MNGTFDFSIKDNRGVEADRHILQGVNWYKIVDYIKNHPVDISGFLKRGFRIEISEAGNERNRRNDF